LTAQEGKDEPLPLQKHALSIHKNLKKYDNKIIITFNTERGAMNKRVKIAVIGTGRMGSVHCRNIVQAIPEAELVALCDIRLEVAQELAAELGIERVVRDYHELLADPDIEAVLIATTTTAHDFITKDAALAGKQIFCEKPLALELEKIDSVLEVVEKAGVKLQVGFNRRFDKNFRQVHDVVATGEMGHPCLLRISSRDPGLPPMEYLRASGGIFLDMTIHDFDMARYLGGEIAELQVMGNVLIDPALKEIGDLDTCVVNLKFANGMVGCIDNSRRAVYGYDQRVEILFSDGLVAVGNESENMITKGHRDGFHTSRLTDFFMQRYGQCYIDEVCQFIACVRDDKPTPINGEDGRLAVLLGHAAWKSFREKRSINLKQFEQEGGSR
jgi:myo-inositol 2-dehydrogenase/D-chiro-inositol 1-dehydrogenase